MGGSELFMVPVTTHASRQGWKVIINALVSLLLLRRGNISGGKQPSSCARVFPFHNSSYFRGKYIPTFFLCHSYCIALLVLGGYFADKVFIYKIYDPFIK